MSPRLLLAVAAAAALVGPAPAAQAAKAPCVDLGLVRAGDCDQGGVGEADGPNSSQQARCPGTDLLPSPSNLDLIRRSTLCLLNGERTARGLRPLREHRALRVAARRYAADMVRGRFFSHEAPSGSTMTSRVRRTTYLRRAVAWSLGENLAWGTGDHATPGRTVRSWMDSPGHRRNVLDRSFRDIGIGVVTGAPVQARGASVAATYVTEFGRRR